MHDLSKPIVSTFGNFEDFKFFNCFLDAIFFLSQKKSPGPEKILDLVHKHAIQRSLVIVEDIEKFEAVASNHKKDCLFFLYDITHSRWKQVMIINNNSKGQ